MKTILEPKPASRKAAAPSAQRPSFYESLIREDLAALVRPEVSPALVEGWMRLAHSTLDGLSRQEFRREVEMALSCIDAAPRSESIQLAASYGLCAW